MSAADAELQKPARASSNRARRRRPPEYAILAMIRQKCENPRNKEFKNYGAQEVHVCERWKGPGGFARFLADIGQQPFPGAGLRRIDPSGNFEPGNVEWAETRPQRLLSHDGRAMPLAAWAREAGLKPTTLRARLRKGWTLERALTREVAYRVPSHWWARRADGPGDGHGKCGDSQV